MAKTKKAAIIKKVEIKDALVDVELLLMALDHAKADKATAWDRNKGADFKEAMKRQIDITEKLADNSDKIRSVIARCREAEGVLLRISYAKPDMLDHSIDVSIIERIARLAKNTLRI